MYRGSGPRIFPIIVVILVIALVIAALVSVGRMIFSGGDSSESSSGESTANVVAALQNDTGDMMSEVPQKRGRATPLERHKLLLDAAAAERRSEIALDTATLQDQTRLMLQHRLW